MDFDYETAPREKKNSLWRTTGSESGLIGVGSSPTRTLPPAGPKFLSLSLLPFPPLRQIPERLDTGDMNIPKLTFLTASPVIPDDRPVHHVPPAARFFPPSRSLVVLNG